MTACDARLKRGTVIDGSFKVDIHHCCGGIRMDSHMLNACDFWTLSEYRSAFQGSISLGCIRYIVASSLKAGSITWVSA